MPQKKSAKKALRQSAKRYDRNKVIRRKIKDLRKKAEKALSEKKSADAVKIYTTLQEVVDKASKAGGYLNRNTASRYKSRLLKKINAVTKK